MDFELVPDICITISRTSAKTYTIAISTLSYRPFPDLLDEKVSRRGLLVGLTSFAGGLALSACAQRDRKSVV